MNALCYWIGRHTRNKMQKKKKKKTAETLQHTLRGRGVHTFVENNFGMQ